MRAPNSAHPSDAERAALESIAARSTELDPRIEMLCSWQPRPGESRWAADATGGEYHCLSAHAHRTTRGLAS